MTRATTRGGEQTSTEGDAVEIDTDDDMDITQVVEAADALWVEGDLERNSLGSID